MSNIPKARELLLELATRLHPLNASDLREIIDSLLYRESPVRRAKRKNPEITPNMRREIMSLAKTDMHVAEIAHRVGVNPGRVSEVLNGLR